MEAKDTVTSACRLCSSADNQAEISFKAGYAEGFKLGVNNLIASLGEGKEYGGREVVEFVEAHRNIFDADWNEWQAFLKEKGL